MRHVLLLSMLGSGLAFAGEPKVTCSLKADADDRVAKGQDLEVKSGQVIKDAIVVDGNLIVRQGASVKSAVALHGHVTIEAGATVRDSIFVLGGAIHVAPGATVKGSRLSLDDGLHLVGEDGGRLDVNISVDGEALGQKLLASVMKENHACRVEAP